MPEKRNKTEAKEKNIKEKYAKENKNKIEEKINFEDIEQKITNEEEYKDYWICKGAGGAAATQEYKEITREKEKKFNMIIELSIPWQRKAIEELIDDIKSMENARSSIEMDNTLGLIYEQENKKIK